MTDYYVKSGATFTDGLSWAGAYTTIRAAMEAVPAGSRIFVSHQHSETTGYAIVATGTVDAPLVVLCVNDGAEPPTTLATTASFNAPGANSLTIHGSAYIYGVQFSFGNSISFNTSSQNYCALVFENCYFSLLASAAAGYLNCGFNSGNETSNSVRFLNCQFKTAHAGSCIRGYKCLIQIDGGSMVSGTTTPTQYFFMSTQGSRIEVSGFDMTNFSSSMSLMWSGLYCTHKVVLRDCRMPTGWNGVLVGNDGIPGAMGGAEMFNCDNADTNYRMKCEYQYGTMASETTIVRTGGATDGTTPLAWKLSTRSIALAPIGILRTPEIVVWNDAIGSEKTVAVEFVHDTAVAAGQGGGTSYAFQDNECWLEVMYLGLNSYPLASYLVIADRVGSATDHASSSTTWTTTGMTTPVKQKLTATFTPQEKGYVHVRVCLGKASKTIYIDPKLTIS